MKDDKTPPPAHDPLWDAAWAWVMRQHERATFDASAQAELTQWLSASPDHRKVYEQASRLWLLSGFVPPVNDIDIPGADAAD
jgi:ferric-dicitrate binding protein FerR (iron transport regulator)